MRRFILRSLGGLFAVAALTAAYIGIQIYTGNYHEVIQGELYRSAQPTGKDIERYAAQNGIKSIINLRGGNENDDWYNEEVATSKKLGIKHMDFRMKASRELTDEQAFELIAMMKDAPKPLLLHCRSGADRTGLAAAIYLAAIAKEGEWPAERQLWLHYGHMPFYINASFAMNRTFERLEPLMGMPNS